MRRLAISLLAVAILALAGIAHPFLTAHAAAPGFSPRLAQQASGPVAKFNVSIPGVTDPNQNATVHQAMTFDASSSQGTGLTYSWNFGDQSPAATGVKVTHSYARVDDFTATLTVTDSAGHTASSTQSVRVVPFLPSVIGRPVLQQVVPAGTLPVELDIQAPGPSVINASLTGDLITSPSVAFSTADNVEAATLQATVADENNSTIAQQIIQKPGGSIPLENNVGLEITYQDSAGATVDLNYKVDLLKDYDQSKGSWSITYPNLSIITGTTDPSQPDVNGYYLKGDPGFHHPDDPLVRKYAIEAARAGGSFPNDPAQIMENIYTYVGGLFNSDDPAQIEPDTVVAQKIADGELVPGQRLEKYICISQTYFLSSLARTLGLPSRELTIALSNPVSQDPNSGDWTVNYVQEGATQVWFDNTWHLYDTWLRIRNLPDYLIRHYSYRAWYSFSAQNYDLVAKDGSPLGLYGHDFAVYQEDGGAAASDEWKLLQQGERDGITITGFPTS